MGILRKGILDVLTRFWLRPNTTRTVLFGAYQGIRFEISPLMQKRLRVFFSLYEANVSAWLKNAVQPGMTVYIVGAHIGIHVLYTAKLMRGRGTIYAFEGWEENFRHLETHIRLNTHLGVNIQPIHKCVASRDGTIFMTMGASDGKHHIAEHQINDDDSGVKVEVEAITLDTFWTNNHAPPHILLIDIEGFELDALKGAMALLVAHKPRLALEHHGKADELTAWLRARGYTIQTDARHIFAM